MEENENIIAKRLNPNKDNISFSTFNVIIVTILKTTFIDVKKKLSSLFLS